MGRRGSTVSLKLSNNGEKQRSKTDVVEMHTARRYLLDRFSGGEPWDQNGAMILVRGRDRTYGPQQAPAHSMLSKLAPAIHLPNFSTQNRGH